MPFDLDTWKSRLNQRLEDWNPRIKSAGVNYIYSLLSAAALWPVAEAARTGDWGAVATLGGVLAGAVGTNLIANRIQHWRDESDAAGKIDEAVESDAALRAEIDVVLEKLDVVPLVRETLSDADKEWFTETLNSETKRLGSNLQIGSVLIRDGTFAIGQNAKALSAGAILVQGDIGRDMVAGGDVTTGDISQGESGTVVTGDVLVHVYNIYTKSSGVPALSQQKFERILGEYLHWVHNAYSKARLYGLESLHTTRNRPVRQLADVFIPITLLRFGQKTSVQDIFLIEREKQRIEIDETRNGERGKYFNLLLVTGGAGTGKSTLLAYLADSLTNAALTGRSLLINLPDYRNFLIPILVPLRYYREYFDLCQQSPQMSLANPRAGTLAGFIPWYLQRRNPALELSEDFIDRMLLGGGCLLMLDGLDEVVSRQERGRVRQQVEDLANDIYPGNLILVTARQTGDQEDIHFGDDFSHLEIGPLEPNQIEMLVYKWCCQLYPSEEQSRTEELVKAIQEINSLRANRDIPPLLSTPLMTTMVVSVKWGETELPRERAKLYEAAVKVILQAQYIPDDPARKELVEWGGPWEEQRDWLSLIALEMHRGGQAGAIIGEAKLRKILDNDYPGVADRFIEAVCTRGGLFEERAKNFQFVHLTFQEYLAARRLAKDREKALAGLEQMVTESWWREVLLLIYGFARQDHAPFAMTYLDWLSKLSGSSELHLAGLELAGSALLELEKPRQEQMQIQAKFLAKSLFNPKMSASLTLRVRAGNTLSRLGDPRFEENLWYLPGGPILGFVEIPAGAFYMGSNPKVDKEAFEDENPQHVLNLPTYYIACYPVTVAQFSSFVEDSSHKPRVEESLLGLSNHPVVWVTWLDAIAYSRWLGEKLRGLADRKVKTGEQGAFWQDLSDGRLRVTIPSEAEWEKAARGTDGRIYPWGDVFDMEKANVDQVVGSSTSAVGCFAQGASPYGVEDLSGNIWEWTRSLWGRNNRNSKYHYPYEPGDGREKLDAPSEIRRVLRGGSFATNQWGARCACREWGSPNSGFNFIGFRVVVSPF